MLFSCKKLDSEQVFLKTACEACKEEVEAEIGKIKGVHYAHYDAEEETFTFHFEKEKSRLEAETWLIENGHLQSPDTTFFVLPSCCPRKDTLSNDQTH